MSVMTTVGSAVCVRLQKNKSSISSVTNATDIVAVVLSPPNRQEEQPITSNTKTIRKGNINSTRINLLIGDQSLSNGQCARVSVSISASSDASLVILMGVDGGGKQHPVSNNNCKTKKQMTQESLSLSLSLTHT